MLKVRSFDYGCGCKEYRISTFRIEVSRINKEVYYFITGSQVFDDCESSIQTLSPDIKDINIAFDLLEELQALDVTCKESENITHANISWDGDSFRIFQTIE